MSRTRSDGGATVVLEDAINVCRQEVGSSKLQEREFPSALG